MKTYKVIVRQMVEYNGQSEKVWLALKGIKDGFVVKEKPLINLA